MVESLDGASCKDSGSSWDTCALSVTGTGTACSLGWTITVRVFSAINKIVTKPRIKPGDVSKHFYPWMSLLCMWSAVKSWKKRREKVFKKVGKKVEKKGGERSQENSQEKNLKARKKSRKEKSSTNICMALTELCKKDTLFDRLKEK